MLAIGCGGSHRQAPAPSDPGREPQPSFVTQVPTSIEGMHERLAAAQRVEHGIVWGRLDEAQSQARLLLAFEEPQALPTWQPFFEAVKNAAREVANAPDLAAAATATAALGAACASCHLSIGGTPKFPTETQPTPSIAISPQMRGHEWATARMWEGLIGPDSNRWFAGAAALSVAPLALLPADEARLAHVDAAGAAGIAADLTRLRGYATRAMSPVDQADREQIVAGLLTTCSHCHSLVRDH